jgi:hypothetical protein
MDAARAWLDDIVIIDEGPDEGHSRCLRLWEEQERFLAEQLRP